MIYGVVIVGVVLGVVTGVHWIALIALGLGILWLTYKVDQVMAYLRLHGIPVKDLLNGNR